MDILVSDNGSEFVNKDFVELAASLGYLKGTSGSYETEGHSLAENIIKSF